MFRWLVLLVVAGAGTLPFLGCSPKSGSQWPPANGPRVAVSFPPLYAFTANVIGDKGTVKSILSSQGPHHADTNVHERVLLEEADLFLVNGLGLDDSLANSLKNSTGNRNLKIVELGEKLEHQYLLESDGSCCQHGDGDAHKHAHDPHIWLSPKVAMKLTEEIRSALRSANSSDGPVYDANAKAYLAKLDKLQKDGDAMLKDKKERGIVTMHGSMAYFADAFKLQIVGVIQKTPGQDPNPKDQAALIEECRKKNVRVIAVEPQYAGRVAEQIKAELELHGLTDVRIIELDPMETALPSELNSDWYETKMRANLAAVAGALR